MTLGLPATPQTSSCNARSGGTKLVLNWFQRKPQAEQSEVYAGLRMQALSVKPPDVGLPTSTESGAVLGLLMEFWATRATVSLVMLVDGTTSLYFGNGGGILG